MQGGARGGDWLWCFRLGCGGGGGIGDRGSDLKTEDGS